MYPLVRLIKTLVRARFASKLEAHESSVISFYCRPWDIDMFAEMNNGRVLTLYDLGRFDLAIRAGLTEHLKKNRWGLVVAGSTIRYRKRIRMFHKVTQQTRFIAIDHRWLYIKQSMWVKGQPVSEVLLRTGVTSKGKTIPTAQVLEAMGVDSAAFMPEGWTRDWIDVDNERPWPPNRIDN